MAYEKSRLTCVHFYLTRSLGATGLERLDRGDMAKLWKSNGQRNEKTGTLIDLIVNGHAVIEPYDPKRGGMRYITKCILKGGEPEIFVPRKEREGKCL